MATIDRIRNSSNRSSQLLAELSATYNDHQSFNQNQNSAASLTQQIQSQELQVKSLSAVAREERAQWEKLDKSTVRKKFSKFTGKADEWNERTQKEEREYQVAQKAEEDAKASLAQMQHNLQQAETERNRAEPTAKRYTELQAELDNLYNYVFADTTPEFPEQEDSKRRFQSVDGNQRSIHTALENEIAAYNSLVDAKKAFVEARDHLNSAESYSNWDRMGGGMIASANKRDEMQFSQNQIKHAHALVNAAKNKCPEISASAQMDVGPQGSGWADVWFDNIFTDMDVHGQIQDSEQRLGAAMRDLEHQIAALKQKIEMRKAELGKANEAMMAAKWELERVRAGVIQNVMGST